MLGGTGNDFFLAGTANETLSGGGGYNDYIFLSGTATRVDTVTDFNPAKDVIGLFGYGTSADAAALASATTANGSTTVTLTDGTTIVLPGVTHLTSVNFF
jgi:Ca2+-binding RTX toxin-like protein